MQVQKNVLVSVSEEQQSISKITENASGYTDSINRSTGTTSKAGGLPVYIVKSDDVVVIPEKSNWFCADGRMNSTRYGIGAGFAADKLKQAFLRRDMRQFFCQVAFDAAVEPL